MASQNETYELITRNLQEVLGGDIIRSILAEGRTLKCYWGEYGVQVWRVLVSHQTHLQGLHRRDDVSDCMGNCLNLAEAI